jgi:protocatechuate 4,5-dioxygenase alpha subunit
VQRHEAGSTTVEQETIMSLYELSRACYDLRDEAKRQQFRAGPETYAASYDLTVREREMLLHLDWRALAEAGVSIYVLTKLGAASNIEFLELEGAMRGMSKKEFVDFLKQQAEQNKAFALGLE